MSDPLGAHAAPGTSKWSPGSEQELLIRTLSSAGVRAAQQQRTILASISRPVQCCDSISAFSAATSAGLGECFFWEKPVEQTALVGVGIAASIEKSGSARFSTAASAWRDLMDDAVITYAPAAGPPPGSGPILFGGFAFDPLALPTPLWAGFPHGLLTLPRFLLSYSGASVTLTTNCMISAPDTIEQNAQEIDSDLRRLQAALEHIPQRAHERPSSRFVVQPGRPASAWKATVAEIVAKIQHGAFEKVVLARDMQVVLADPAGTFEINSTLRRLRESYPGAYVFAVQRGERFFVGATPERLIKARDGQVHTMALAGSARRGASAAEDVQLGLELLQSEKNKHEHAIVVAMVREALKRHCTNVHVPAAPQLLKLKNVQHLQTPITADLIHGRCMLDVMADLHPTPAVGGFPRHAALEEIRSSEKLARGWYAGPLGWIDAGGHGEFAVALRCGLIDGAQATLFAGCGIVDDSEPEVEYAESCLKFQAMLRGLDVSNEG